MRRHKYITSHHNCAIFSGTSGSYVAVLWSPGFAGVAAVCAPYAPVSGCVQPFDAGNALNVYTGVPPVNYAHHFEIYSIAPVFDTGYALLGELNKFVRVSPARMLFCNSTFEDDTTPTLTFAVAGASDESVEVHVLVPGSIEAAIQSVVLVFPAGGGVYEITCTGTQQGDDNCAAQLQL